MVMIQVFKQRAVDARAVRKEKRQEGRIRLRKEVRRPYASKENNTICVTRMTQN